MIVDEVKTQVYTLVFYYLSSQNMKTDLRLDFQVLCKLELNPGRIIGLGRLPFGIARLL